MAVTPGAAARTAPARGLTVDERYRLDQVRAEHRAGRGSAVLWRATDLALDRHVALLMVSGQPAAGRRKLLAAAAAAATVTDARFARVLDAGEMDLDAGTACWVASEWVEGPTLAAAVRGAPLPAPVAAHLVAECADALAAAARGGVRHGRLHPGQILLPVDAPARITGLRVAAVLHPDEPEVDDARALGGLLFAALTGRWPLPGWTGLPGLDTRTVQQARPRAVRGGVPRDADEVTHRALVGDYLDAAAVARAVRALPMRAPDEPQPPAAPTGPGAWSRWAWRIVPPLLVLAVGLTGWAIGSDLGRIPTGAAQPRAQLPPVTDHAPGQSRARLVWRAPPAIRSFDPAGDGEENDAAAGLAVDHDSSTAWTTSTYRNDPRLGGLKPGVGLLIDLGRPASVRLAALELGTAGADLQVRAGNQVPQQADDLRVVAARTNAPTHTRLTLDTPTRARYWLVWLTSLPPAPGGYQASVVEIALLG